MPHHENKKNKDNPDYSPDLHQLIIQALKNNNITEASKHIEEAEKQQSSIPQLPILKALHMKAAGNIKKAIESLQEFLSTHPEDTHAQITLADILYQQNEYSKAVQYYKRATINNPLISHPYFNCGLAYCQTEQFELAKEEFIKTINIDPEHTGGLNQLGQLALNNQQYQTACDYFSQALLLNDEQPETWHSLGQAEFFSTQYQNAVDSFSQCLSLNAKHTSANQECANAHLNLNQLNDALRHYHRQLEIEICDDSYYNIAVCLMYQEKISDAIHYFKKALESDPTSLNTHLNLGSLYLKNNKLKEAQHHYEKALTYSPEHEEAQHILSAITKKTPAIRAPNAYIESLFDQYANHYDQHLTQHLNYQTHQLIYDHVDTELFDKKSLSILDLGCGTGLCGKLFSPYAKRLVGVDLSPRMLEIAKHKAIYHQLIQSDIFDLPKSDQSYDLILAADVFPYSGDLDLIISECGKRLCHNGSLIFSVESTHLDQDYLLQTSIRYAHSYAYLHKILNKANFKSFSIHTATLRQQYKKPVKGYIVIAQKHSLETA
jgi:predicted TPR repeat methyltransferase